MLKLSIVIPVYNAEKHLRRCLDSVVQALGDIPGEILAIDNDSTDDSLLVLKEYQEKYPKLFSVLRCHTKGAAAVRNFGATKAKGEYIWFIDADDEITKTSIDKLIKKADEADADLVMMGAKRIYSKDHTDYLSSVSSLILFFDQTDFSFCCRIFCKRRQNVFTCDPDCLYLFTVRFNDIAFRNDSFIKSHLFFFRFFCFTSFNDFFCFLLFFTGFTVLFCSFSRCVLSENTAFQLVHGADL